MSGERFVPRNQEIGPARQAGLYNWTVLRIRRNRPPHAADLNNTRVPLDPLCSQCAKRSEVPSFSLAKRLAAFFRVGVELFI